LRRAFAGGEKEHSSRLNGVTIEATRENRMATDDPNPRRPASACFLSDDGTDLLKT
jgi:hypothetical protein